MNRKSLWNENRMERFLIRAPMLALQVLL